MGQMMNIVNLTFSSSGPSGVLEVYVDTNEIIDEVFSFSQTKGDNDLITHFPNSIRNIVGSWTSSSHCT